MASLQEMNSIDAGSSLLAANNHIDSSVGAVSELSSPNSTLNNDEADNKRTQISIDLEGDFKLLSHEDLTRIGQFCVFDELGNRHSMSDLWSEFTTIFVFARSFLCFTSKEYVEDLALIPKDDFVKHQVRLVVIGCAHWKHIRNFRRLTKFPYFMFCDVDYDIYKYLQFSKNQNYGNYYDSCHVKSSNFKGFLSSAYRAITTSPAFDYQGDFSQQGGCLIVGPGGEFHYLHVDKHARDHCPINVILKKVGMPEVDFVKARSTLAI